MDIAFDRGNSFLFADLSIFFVLFFLIILAELLLLHGADKTAEAACRKGISFLKLCETLLASSSLFFIHTQTFYRVRRLFLKEG